MLPLYLVTFFVVGGIVAVVALSHLKRFKLTSSTQGTVIRAVERPMTDSRGVAGFETEVTAEYQAGGKRWSVQRILTGRHASRYATGRTVKVLYNPAEPHQSDLA